jgi:phosphoribosylformylglycinamidine cyclo-ligase
VSGDAYAGAGVDTGRASSALRGLVAALESIDPGAAKRSLIPPGHYASVVDLDGRTAVAICTDGVGTKLIVAEQAERFDTVGIDCVAMCVNDLICLGAQPIAMVDYIAVERSDPDVLKAIGVGLKRGAEQAGIEIPGGELAELPEMLTGHPSPGGIDLVGAGIGIVTVDGIVTGSAIEAGDAVIGLPSSGLHSNGYTLARQALLATAGYSLDDVPPGLSRALADELLEPTTIYVRAIAELMRTGVSVRGLAHITGDGLANLLRLNAEIGFEIDQPPQPAPIFGLIQDAAGISRPEMYETFNMGVGFCVVVGASDEEKALELVRGHYDGARRIGRVNERSGEVSIPPLQITATKDGFRET